MSDVAHGPLVSFYLKKCLKLVYFGFVCFLVWSFSSQSIISNSFGDIVITGPLKEKGFVAFLTYCYKKHQFKLIISKDP